MTVKDNGPGIEQPLLRQLTAGQYKSKGTGIGLNNIHERIQSSSVSRTGSKL